MLGGEKPFRRFVRNIRRQADDVTHITHYDRQGQALLICVMCLADEDQEKELNQAITIWNGSAICEWHLFPEGHPYERRT